MCSLVDVLLERYTDYQLNDCPCEIFVVGGVSPGQSGTLVMFKTNLFVGLQPFVPLTAQKLCLLLLGFETNHAIIILRSCSKGLRSYIVSKGTKRALCHLHRV